MRKIVDMEHDPMEPVGWLVSLIAWVLVLIPVGKILQRAGFHWGWAVLTVIPVLGIMIVWLMLALREWKLQGQA